MSAASASGASPVASGAMSALEGSDHHDVFSHATPPLVLFVCTHNSARSQLAEGLLRQKYGDRYRAASAGTVARGVHPLAAEALEAVGIDASGHASKTIESLGEITPDIVVTVCDNAREACPYIPAERNIHHAFRDPSAVEGTDDDRRRAFAEVREEISEWLDATFG